MIEFEGYPFFSPSNRRWEMYTETDRFPIWCNSSVNVLKHTINVGKKYKIIGRFLETDTFEIKSLWTTEKEPTLLFKARDD